MRMYRLEACACCRIVRVELVTAVVTQRERAGADRPGRIDGTKVWWVDFCDPCRVGYEASLAPSPAGDVVDEVPK
jgi:hypothetical protein